ncbi:MAG TPA: DegT/DnrJ/EryC1/StrS family aminotransferase [Microthrixaceae bacterium]|nr:DegT/DnrJ/EryC1/StrS family aminotransferase [Microthrixaceae bacterium]
MSNVPFVDLAWQHQCVADEVQSGFAEVMATTSFIDGKPVAAFETEFAEFCGRTSCVGVANGTDAIELGLRAHGIGPGDEVILPANTFIATAEAVARCGATPVLADCDPVQLLIDPVSVADHLTSQTRAVIGVHLYGQIAPMERLAEVVAGRDEVVLFEDAAQAQGATRNGLGIGSWGTAATSFYPGKNLGAYGDAGAVVTDDEQVATLVRKLGAHGSAQRYVHDVVGMNSRLDTLQAVVLRAKLRHLAEWNQLRRDAADRYTDLLSGIEDLQLPSAADGNEHVWHLYVVQTGRRADAMAALSAEGIGNAIHYPAPVHRHAAFSSIAPSGGGLSVSETTAERIFSLPMFPGITREQQESVAETLRSTLGAS